MYLIRRLAEALKGLEKRPALLLPIFWTLALVVRLLVTAKLNLLSSDTFFYDRVAGNLLQGRGLWEPGTQVAIFFPAFPTLLAGIYYFSGQGEWAVASLVNIFLGSFTCLGIYFLGKEVFNRGVGLLACFLAIFTPSLAFWSGFVHPESLYTLLLVLATLSLVRGRRLKKPGWAIMGGSLLGLVALTRPYFLGFLPLVGLLFFLGHNKGHRLKAVAQASAALLAVLILYSIYIKVVERVNFGMGEISVKGQWSRYWGGGELNPNVIYDIYSNIFEVSMASFNALDKGIELYIKMGNIGNRHLLITWQKNENRELQSYFRLGLKKLKIIWALAPVLWNAEGLFKRMVQFFYGAMLLLAAYALIISASDWRRTGIPFSYLVSFTILYIPLYAPPYFRARTPFEPYLIIFSAQGLYALALFKKAFIRNKPVS